MNFITTLLASLFVLTPQLSHALDIESFAVTIDNTKFYQLGDLLVESQIINDSEKLNSESEDTEGARPKKVVLWEDGVLPIVFKDNVGPELRETVFAACAEWSQNANVRCKSGKYKNRKLIVSRSFAGVKTGCWAMLGQETYAFGLKRRMNLGDHCDSYSTVLHELGHAFGLAHEHQRADRDNYVEILENNIDEQFLSYTYKLNFKQQETELLTPYDFLSIMHYSQTAFSKNHEDTIRPIVKYKDYGKVMGHAKHLSDLDKIAIKSLYGERQ